MLDINTPKGQISLRQEAILLRAIKRKLGTNIIETDKKESAIIDGLLVKKGELRGILECKCRNISSTELKRLSTWLVTYKKLRSAAWTAEKLKTPLYAAIYCLKDDNVLWLHLTDNQGKFIIDFEVHETETAETINRGSITRENAYIPVSYGKWFKIHEQDKQQHTETT